MEKEGGRPPTYAPLVWVGAFNSPGYQMSRQAAALMENPRPCLSPSPTYGGRSTHRCICRCNGLNEIPRASFPSDLSHAMHLCLFLRDANGGRPAATRTTLCVSQRSRERKP